MPRKILYPLLTGALVLAMSGCTGGSSDIEASLGEEFTLSIGQSALITGEDLEIEFEDVIEDSRCPRDVTCIWAGRVSCIVTITDNDFSYRMVLTEPGLTDHYTRETYEEYHLAFHVEPYPEAGKNISKDDYRLLLIVSE
jgi:hypothetical protein